MRVTLFIIISVIALVYVKAGSVSTPTKVSVPSVTKDTSSDKKENPVSNFIQDVKDSFQGQTISASVKDTTVNGIDGFNINWVFSFKVLDYILGFKYNINDLKKLPDKLFIKKTFETPGDSSVSLQTLYDVEDKLASVDGEWKSKTLGMSVTASADSKDKLTSFGVSTTQKINDEIKVALSGAYDNLKNKLKITSKVNSGDIGAKLEYDTKSQDPILTVSANLDSNHVVSPSVSLKTGSTSYQLNRKYNGGQLVADYYPGENVVLEWTDEGGNGDWVTKATIPVDNQAATKVSFARKWSF